MNGTDVALPIILSIAEIFGLLSIGAVCRYFRYIEEPDIDKWSKLVLDFLYPAFVFSSITIGFQTGRRNELWVLPLIGLGISMGGALLGLGLKYGLRTKNKDMERTFLYFCAVNNYGFLPVVIVQNLWGGTAMLANLFFLTLGSTIATWTVGVGVMAWLEQAYSSRGEPHSGERRISFGADDAGAVRRFDVQACGMADHVAGRLYQLG
jgi:predicted permease